MYPFTLAACSTPALHDGTLRVRAAAAADGEPERRQNLGRTGTNREASVDDDATAALKVRPGTKSLPHHPPHVTPSSLVVIEHHVASCDHRRASQILLLRLRMVLYSSSIEGSKHVSMTWRAISSLPWLKNSVKTDGSFGAPATAKETWQGGY